MGNNKWTPELIVAKIKALHENGENLNSASIKKLDSKLYASARRHFGNYRNAVESCGIDYDEYISFKYWNKQNTKTEFLSLYNEGKITKIYDVFNMDRKLDYAVKRYYGSYETICVECGIDIEQLRPNKPVMTKKELLDNVLELKQSGLPINPSSIYTNIKGSEYAILKNFGTYESMMQEISEESYKHIVDITNSKSAGRKFELLLKSMFSDLEESYEYQYRGIPGIVPDFYDTKTNTMIDAKLSSWTLYNCNTAYKYTPHCDKLVVIFLRGDYVKYEFEKVELRAVSEYYRLLKERGLSKYIDEFESIKSSLDNALSTQNKAV